MLDRLAADLPAGEGRDSTLALLRRHYRPEATLAAAAAGMLAELLGPLGIAVFDPTHPAAKSAQAPLALSALERQSDLELALVARNGALTSRGEDAGVTVGDGASMVMLEGPGGRDRLVVRDGASRPGGAARHTPWRRCGTSPWPIRPGSPPTCCSGPWWRAPCSRPWHTLPGRASSSISALAEPLYPGLGVPRQLPVPRWSGVLVEPRVDRVLEKFDATLEELLAPGQVIEGRVVRSQMPEEALAALARLRAAISAEYAILASAAADDRSNHREAGRCSSATRPSPAPRTRRSG